MRTNWKKYQRGRRPRIGIYMQGTGVGGPWRYVHSILTRINLYEFEPVLFCHLQDGYAPRSGVRVVTLPCVSADIAVAPFQESIQSPDTGRIRKLWRAMAPASLRLWAGFGLECRTLARVFEHQRLDLFHTNYTGCDESPVAARMAGIPRVLGTFHVNPTVDPSRKRDGFHYRVLEWVSNRCLHKAIAVSQATGREWCRRTCLDTRRLVNIHNGIDPGHFQRKLSRTDARRILGLPTDALLVGGVGRLDEVKGFSYLIDAVTMLASRYPTLMLLLAGDGPLRRALETQAARNGIADRIRFLGFCNDVQPVYDAIDVFVLSSQCEALPYSLLEAMASGLPCVGTRVSGVPEVIEAGKTGILVTPRDHTQLALGLIPLLDSPELREKMGAAGRVRVEHHFTEDQMVCRTFDVYRDLLGMAPVYDRM